MFEVVMRGKCVCLCVMGGRKEGGRERRGMYKEYIWNKHLE